MKKLAFLFLVLPLAGCPYRYPIEVFNNSGAIVYVHGCSPACEILPGETKAIPRLEHHDWSGDENARSFIWLSVRGKLLEYQLTRDMFPLFYPQRDSKGEVPRIVAIQPNGDIYMQDRITHELVEAPGIAGYPLRGVKLEWAKHDWWHGE